MDMKNLTPEQVERLKAGIEIALMMGIKHRRVSDKKPLKTVDEIFECLTTEPTIEIQTPGGIPLPVLSR